MGYKWIKASRGFVGYRPSGENQERQKQRIAKWEALNRCYKEKYGRAPEIPYALFTYFNDKNVNGWCPNKISERHKLSIDFKEISKSIQDSLEENNPAAFVRLWYRETPYQFTEIPNPEEVAETSVEGWKRAEEIVKQEFKKSFGTHSEYSEFAREARDALQSDITRKHKVWEKWEADDEKEKKREQAVWNKPPEEQTSSEKAITVARNTGVKVGNGIANAFWGFMVICGIAIMIWIMNGGLGGLFG